MKKILVVFSVLLLMGIAFDVQATDFSEWAVGDTIGLKGESAQFCAVDYEGKLWITDYGTPGNVGLYVFNPDGSQASFSPITAGLDENGDAFSIANAGGVAYYDSVIYAISDNPGAVLRFKASDGTPLNGWTVSYRTGDVDVDTTGHVFVSHKIEAMFSVYDTDGTELTGSPFGTAGWHINRGISVMSDGSKVFIADESSDVIAMYTGSISGTVADYTQGTDFMTGLNNPSACEIDPNGRMWISNTGANEVIITELDGTILQTITDFTSPRGAAFDFDNNLAYVAHFTSATNMAHQLIPKPRLDWELNINSYSFFKNDHRTRGIAYNPATGHLLIASRTGGDNVFILDAATGDSLSKLDMTGISGGTYTMNIIRVDSDGVIYLGNLGGISGSIFKIYRWADESASPTVAFEGAVTQRTGDSFGLYGTGTSTTLYASGTGSTHIYAFTTTDGSSFTITDTITVAAGLARGGISPIGNGEFWVNGAGTSTRHIDADGSLIAGIDLNLVDNAWHNVAYIPTSGGRKLVAIVGRNTTIRGKQIQVWDITSSETNPALLDTVDLTGAYNTNTNATGDLAFKDNEDGTITIYEMITNNGIAAWTLAVPPAIPIHPEPEELYSWWEMNAGDYTFFQSDNNTRGMDLNPVTGHLLVASRTGGASIHILEGENSSYLGSMDMTNVTGGVFAINLVSVANDGVIYGCNLTTSGTGFKFYRWGDESSAPTVAFEGDLDQRIGDSFTVIGSGANTIVYASGSNVTKIYIFTTTDGISFSLFDEIPILSSLARGGIAPVADTLGSDIWVNCSGKQAALIDTSGTVIATIDTSMNVYFAHIDFMETGDGRKLIAVAGGNCGDVPACMGSEVWDVTDPFNPWRFAYGSMTNSPVANLNGTGIAILEEKENGVLNLYHLLSNNGIALYSEEEFIPPILVDVTFEVNMSVQTILGKFNIASDFVDIAGNFNDYGGNSMVLDDSDGDSVYSITVLDLQPGENLEYKFRINGSWDDATCEFPFGGPNRTYVVPDTNSVVSHWYDDKDRSFLGIEDISALPKEFALNQNYPNPFNPTTFIKYDLPKVAIVKIVIYDLMGREVRTLLNEKQNAGYKSITWNGRDNNGNMVSSGIYIYQMITDEFQKTRKMMLLK